MKRIVLVAVIIVAATVRFAAADSDIGCGLGTQLWEGEKGLVPKVLGATTNGTFGNQTFGITTGTLGCSSEGVITADARLRMFAGANLDNLARDMAQGQGETLDAFGRLMNVQDADKAHFNQFTKAHFGELFADSDATAGEMIASLNRLLAQDPPLSVSAQS
jgi:hypothetical protein